MYTKLARQSNNKLPKLLFYIAKMNVIKTPNWVRKKKTQEISRLTLISTVFAWSVHTLQKTIRYKLDLQECMLFKEWNFANKHTTDNRSSSQKRSGYCNHNEIFCLCPNIFVGHSGNDNCKMTSCKPCIIKWFHFKNACFAYFTKTKKEHSMNTRSICLDCLVYLVQANIERLTCKIDILQGSNFENSRLGWCSKELCVFEINKV